LKTRLCQIDHKFPHPPERIIAKFSPCDRMCMQLRSDMCNNYNDWHNNIPLSKRSFLFFPKIMQVLIECVGTNVPWAMKVRCFCTRWRRWRHQSPLCGRRWTQHNCSPWIGWLLGPPAESLSRYISWGSMCIHWVHTYVLTNDISLGLFFVLFRDLCSFYSSWYILRSQPMHKCIYILECIIPTAIPWFYPYSSFFGKY
jgi:hypothetical protein